MLIAALVTTVLVVGLLVVLFRGGPQHADLGAGSRAEPEQDRAGATSELLFRVQRALRRGDAAALSDLADPDVPGAARELSALSRNVRHLRIDHLRLQYLDESDHALTPEERQRFGPEAWKSEVQLSWRFAGVDRSISSLDVPVVTDWEGRSAVFDTSRAIRGYRVPLWFTEPLAVRRTPDTLVLAGDPRTARELQQEARVAVVTVRHTLPDWHAPLVVEAPSSDEEFRAASGMSRTDSRAIAAVTTTTDGSALHRAPVHIFLNPRVFDPLGPAGRQIVLSHEATHVALGAATTDLPLWLSEGIADYVALARNTLPDTVLAAQIRALVQKDGPPKALPGSAEFDGANKDIGAWYEAAWLAVRLLARTYGTDELLRFYARSEADGDTTRAFRDVLGTTEKQFVKAWRAELVELAR